MSLDMIGRLVRRQNADGSVSTLTYGPLLVEEADEEDTRTDSGAVHKATPTRRKLDAAGKVAAIQQNLGGRWIATSYEYDVKGHLIRHVDAGGNVVRCWYDLLGRQLRVDRPERASVVVRDAAGNPVEARGRDGTVVLRQFDANNRLVAVRYGSAASAPVQTFTYHDSGRAAPPDAGLRTVGGRLVRVDDEGGTTLFDYDERGRRSLKRWRQPGQAKTYDLGFTYRADGKIATITYPDGGSGRHVFQHLYDARGCLRQIPSVATSIEYDLSGQRKRITYANGTVETFARDDVTGILADATLTGPSGAIRSTRFTWDKVGNLLRIDSPDAKLAATYTYDDLYRLTAARTDAGESFAYSYNDAGGLTHKSDVGDYRYGEHGAPTTCLTSAGPQAFAYSPMGDMVQTPWGTQTFDPLGRLNEIAAPGGAARLQFTYDFNGMRVSARSTGAVSPPSNLLTPDPLFAIDAGVLVLNFFLGSTIAMRQPVSGPPVFLHLDHLGGVVAVTDVSGAVVDRLRYDPYGKLVERNGSGPLVPFGFSGGVPEAWSGLLYLQAVITRRLSAASSAPTRSCRTCSIQ